VLGGGRLDSAGAKGAFSVRGGLRFEHACAPAVSGRAQRLDGSRSFGSAQILELTVATWNVNSIRQRLPNVKRCDVMAPHPQTVHFVRSSVHPPRCARHRHQDRALNQ
jgi:hypothetical protein